MEIFKEIKGFEDYEVSNYGNVRSLKRNIVLRPSFANGYLHVGLYKDGKKFVKYIHRLVAIAFIPNPNNLQEVNHKDENPQNNKAENLEWCTHEYNLNYGTRNERSSIKQKGKIFSEEHKRKLSESHIGKLNLKSRNHPNKSKLVVAVKDGEVVMEFASTREAERHGFKHGNVSKCCNKCFNREGNNYYGGYQWYYQEEYEKIKNGSPN